ncbi:MAG: pyridoxal phosphate-dependent aminotransferase, partial [Sediminibacterium sp.]
MPNISSKAVAMPSSPIRKLVPFSEAAKAAGKTVYHLNIGQPDIETPEIVREKMKALDIKVIEYSNSDGIGSYKKGLTGY